MNNLTDILNEFLSIGKIEDGKIQLRYNEFNLKHFIDNICAEMRSIAKPGQQFHCSHVGEELIESDDSLLRIVITNLLSNAIKFTGDEGVVNIHSVVTKDKFSLSVKDNGIGISPEDQQHLFERFFRASNVTNIQGTGLGLHIVGKYVELMDGTIIFESQLESGTSFTISFNNNHNK